MMGEPCDDGILDEITGFLEPPSADAILPSCELREVSENIEDALARAGSQRHAMLRGRLHVKNCEEEFSSDVQQPGSASGRHNNGGGLFAPPGGTGPRGRGGSGSFGGTPAPARNTPGAMTAAAILAKLEEPEEDPPLRNTLSVSSMGSVENASGAEIQEAQLSSSPNGISSILTGPVQEKEENHAMETIDNLPNSPVSQGDIRSSRTFAAEPNEPVKVPSSTAEAVAILVDKMLESPEDEDLQIRALRSLRRLSSETEGRKLIGNSGGIQIVSDCMRRFSNNSGLVVLCCMVIANVCFGSGINKERCRKSRCVDHVISHLSSFTIAANDMAYVCLAARNVTSNCRPNQLYFSTNGGVDGLCKAISRYEDDVEVQTQAIAAVGNTAHANKTAQMRLREAGGLELLLETMKRHAGHKPIQDNCLTAIANLSTDNERNRGELGSLGAVDRIIGTMRLHRAKLETQLAACVALRHLAFDEKNRDMIGTCDGISTILEALSLARNVRDHRGISEILKALSNSTFDHIENKLTVVRCDGLEIVSALVVPDSPGPTLEGGLRVLRNITDCSEEVRAVIRDSDVVYTILDCMRSTRNDPGVAEHALALLLNLMADGIESEGVMGDLDPAEVSALTQSWMELFPNVTNIQLHGKSLIRQFDYVLERARGSGNLLLKRTKLKKVSNIGAKIGRHLPFARVSSSRSDAYDDDELEPEREMC